MERTILAVWPRTENTFGIAVFSALVKSGLFKKCSICHWLARAQSFIIRVILFVWVVSWRYRVRTTVKRSNCSIIGGMIRYTIPLMMAKTKMSVTIIDSGRDGTWSRYCTNFTTG